MAKNLNREKWEKNLTPQTVLTSYSVSIYNRKTLIID